MPLPDTARKGNWMQTANGHQFWPLDPRADEVFIEDIAWSLAHLCRYNGHSSMFYSVAEHSVLVSQVLDGTGYELCGLMHDGTEAYCADVPRPLKAMLTGYAAIEDGIWRVVAERFGLPAVMPKAVHVADDSVMLAEKSPLMGDTYKWACPGTPANVTIRGLDPRAAYSLFMDRFRSLT